MLPKSLVSLQHPFVKHLVRLRKEKSLRRDERRALVFGKKLVEELISYKVKIEAILIEPELLESGYPLPEGVDMIVVTPNVLKKITGLPQQEPLAAIVKTPAYQNLLSSPHLLVLDGVSDPGNVGTLIRSALALGWSGVYLTENTCDPFNDKAIRAAKGATFRIPLQIGTWKEFLAKSNNFQVLIADMHGSAPSELSLKPPLALILSKESEGARKEALEKFEPIAVPMAGDIESLNVASAGAILLHQLKTPVLV